MRYIVLAGLVCLLLAGCGGAVPTPTVDIRPTQTRIAEISQLATLSAPTNTPTPTNTATPTNTPVPPTFTPIPPTATLTPRPASTPIPPTAAAQKYNDLPIPANAVLVQAVSPGNVIFSVPENELVIAAFMKREWAALGLIYQTLSVQSNATFYVYSYPTDQTRLVSYGVQRISENSSVLGVIDTKPPTSQTQPATSSPPQLVPLRAGTDYRDPQGRFTFLVPLTWAQIQVAGTEVAFRGPATSTGNVPTMNVTLEQLPSTATTLEQYNQAGESNLRQVFPTYQPVSLEQVRVGNAPAYKRVYTAVIGGQSLELEQVYLVSGGVAYIMTFGVAQRDFAGQVVGFDQIAGSFQLGSR